MKKIINILFMIYIGIILRITVFRSSFSIDNLMENGQINLALFKEYIPIVQAGDWFTFSYLFIGNIIWFAPFGMYLEYEKKGNKFWKVLLFGFAFSFFIETLQYVFGTGFSELDDLILNTIGVFLGAIFARIIRCLRKRG